ncbi:MAG: outer membrane lipid asymmetry maintenance protein MlaD, partial [Alphaproteobacteria bacterium]
MHRNIIETVMGGVVLLVAAGFVYLAFQSGSVGNGSGYLVSAEFDNASGLTTGSEVRMSGVKVGTVVDQRLDPDTFFAVVTISIVESIKLPRDTSARILADGLLGSNYVALEPGGED